MAAASAGFFLSPQQTDILSAAPQARSQLAILVEGELDQVRLKNALNSAVRENEALRTIFQRQTGMKLPFQIVLDELQPTWTGTHVPGFGTDRTAFVRQAMLQEAEEAIPTEASQLRSSLFSAPDLFSVPDRQALWILTAHSATADPRSLQLLLSATIKRYAGEVDSTEESLRYVQFGQWQNDLVQESDEAAEDAKKFWASQTTDTTLFANELGVAAESRRHIVLPSAGDLGQAAASLDSGPSDVALAAWGVAVGRWFGQQRVRLGRLAEGREYEELGKLIGAVEKILPALVDLKPHLSFSELVGQLHTQRAEAAAMQEYFAPQRSFEVGFAWHELDPPATAAGTRFSAIAFSDTAYPCPLDLTVCLCESKAEMQIGYQASVIAEETANELAAAFMSLLLEGIAEPRRRVDELSMISSERREHILADGSGVSVPIDPAPMHVLISAQAARTPDSLAVRGGEGSLTYAELEERSNRLAHFLVGCGVKPGSLVGLLVGRSAGMMMAVLAILKAGGAYVALGADQPRARIAQQLAGIEVLITESALLDQFSPFAGRTVVLDGADRAWEQEPASDPGVALADDALAYVIYTSGSTGTPKGVGVRHRNLVNYASHMVRALELQPGLQFATVSTLAADLGNTVVFPALMTGGCLHVLSYEVATDARRMAAYNAEHGIDVLKIVPSHLAALLDAGAEDGSGVLPRRYLITGGEALKPALVERVAAHCAVINHYGPTETTVGSLMLPLDDFDWKSTKLATIPLGRPISNTRVYVLDANRQLVPPGVAGELYIAGAGVTAGYIGQPERTAERFVPDPFGPEPDQTMYRTGDLVRWLPSGLVEFLGRTDDQVKIRGFRVELGEIESVLAAQPGVRQSVVLARPKPGMDGAVEDRQVVAYVVLDRQHGVTPAALKQALAERLPDYMVPAAFVELSRLPLTANGKIDRKQLPEPEERASRAYIAPASATEELVAQIWAEVLKVQQISTDENFFDLGGHSLLATQVISRIRETFQLEIPLRTMFEAPILHNFSTVVDRAKGSAPAAVAGPIRRAVRQPYRASPNGQ